MTRGGLLMRVLVVAGVTTMLLGQPAIADKPPWAGGGKGGAEHGKGKDKDEDRGQERHGGGSHFDDRQRGVVREYFERQHRSGHCPPGLAKKNNGCMPPGQAKKWRMNQPLAREVVFYDLPPVLVTQIGAPPPGYRYVRVASDILMIAVGTGMVVDAIIDLGRM